MLRLALSLIVLASPLAALDKAQHCASSAAIVADAVVARAAGEEQKKTFLTITAGLEGDQENYAEAVQPIVEWIWALPEDQLTDDVAAAYESACLEQ